MDYLDFQLNAKSELENTQSTLDHRETDEESVLLP